MAKFENNVNVHDAAPVANWISQINAGGTVYDIATHHSITFQEGTETTTWNGLSDLTVVIPTIQDIVQTPIEFAGTVAADEKVDWIAPHGKDGKAEVGNLVFITADCTFAGKPCEAGDMAIYDGEKWNIVSGENQVEIVGSEGKSKVTVAVGAAADVLTVEGKTLALTLDYAELNKHISTTPGSTEDVVFGDMNVGSKYLKLSKADDANKTIGVSDSFERATKLADGTVTLTNADKLVSAVDFGTFTAGTLPSFTKNQEKTFAVDGGSVKKVDGTDFVDSVSNSAVTFVDSDGTGNFISVMTGITAGVGASFVNGIHTTKADETADITIAGCIAPVDGVNAKFVTGLEGSLKAVTSISVGDISLDNTGSDFVTGLGAEKNDKSGDVLTDVTVSAKNDTSVLNSATVTDHVLSFGSTDVASSVEVSYKSKSFNMGKYKYTAPEATTTAFTTGGFTKADDIKYTLDKANETTYAPTTKNWGLNTPALTVTKSAYQFVDSGMKATVPADSFITSATEGTLPTWTGGKTTDVTVTGSVATDLSFETKSFNAVKDDALSIVLPGAYSLVEGTAADGVEVGAAGALADCDATVVLTDYVTGVTINTTAVKE